jgi:hypothetical protein
MVSLYRDPHGKKIFSKSAVAQHASGTNKSRGSRTVESLEGRVKELESRLSKYDNPEIQNFEPMSEKTSEVPVSFVRDENGEIC